MEIKTITKDIKIDELEEIMKELNKIEVHLDIKIKEKQHKLKELKELLNKDDKLSIEYKDLIEKISDDNIDEASLIMLQNEIDNMTETCIKEFNDMVNENKNFLLSLRDEDNINR